MAIISWRIALVSVLASHAERRSSLAVAEKDRKLANNGYLDFRRQLCSSTKSTLLKTCLCVVFHCSRLSWLVAPCHRECRESAAGWSHLKVQAATSASCVSSGSSRQSPTSSPQYQEHPRPASILRTLSSTRLACRITQISFRAPIAPSLRETS